MAWMIQQPQSNEVCVPLRVFWIDSVSMELNEQGLQGVDDTQYDGNEEEQGEQEKVG